MMRYLPLSEADRSAMLKKIGAGSVDELFRDVPEEARLKGPIHGLPMHASEMAVERQLTAMARKNMVAGEVPFFLGCGAYKHHVPASVDHLIQRGEFLTAYTPYQPEIAQGTLQVLFEFQTQVARLLGCEVANASMYDGSTACWEAIGMARRITRKSKAIISSGLHPHYVSVCKTMAKFTGDTLEIELPTLEADTDTERLIASIDGETNCVVVQYPDILGRITDLTPIAEAAHAKGALLVAVVTEPVALGLIKAPGEMGADIVVGEGQSIGVGLQFGGPYVGLFATREKFVRQMPGRLAGETVDAEGKRGFQRIDIFVADHLGHGDDQSVLQRSRARIKPAKRHPAEHALLDHGMDRRPRFHGQLQREFIEEGIVDQPHARDRRQPPGRLARARVIQFS
jgi:glycine dehydrogenase subunit 1